MRRSVQFWFWSVQSLTAAAALGAPQINSGGVVNAASYTAKLARGSLGAIFGANFAAGAGAQADSLPLPLSLAGVSVTVGGIPAPLVFVSANQIDFQVPFEVSGSSAAVVVTSGGAASNSISVTLADYAVGVFTNSATSDPIIAHGADNTLVSASSPAVPGEPLVIYATGIGKLNRPASTGAGAPVPAAAAVDTPSITVGGSAAKVQFAGLTPGSVGLAQFNITLPDSLPSGNLPLVIQFPGDSSAPVNLAVKGNISGGTAISVSPNILDFGSVATGQTKDLAVEVSNRGAATLTVAALREFGIGFTVLSPKTPFDVAPGGTQNVTVRFEPLTTGAARGSLSIASNDPLSPLSLALEGVGVLPGQAQISVAPNALAFGNVTVGQSASLIVTVTNEGNATLNVASIAASAGFSIAPSSAFTVDPGASVTVNVTFAPTALGAAGGTLTISSNDPLAATTAIPLSGTGIPFVPLACGFTLGPDIYAKWTALGAQNGILGCPTANEIEAPKSATGTTGRSATFTHGAIYWIRNGRFAGQAHEVHGCAVSSLNASGGTGGFLGFPITDVYPVTGGVRNDFEGGYILGVTGSGVCPAFHLGGDFTGLWNTSQEFMALVMDGANANGTYGTGATGMLSGSLGSNALGVALLGNYQDNQGAIGTFSFNLAPDGQSFTGTFQQVGSPVFNAWNGTRYTAGAAGFYNPMRLDFGTVTVGQSADLVLAITNIGQTQLGIYGIHSDQAVFAPVNNVPSVGPGATQTVTIRFTPSAVGPVSGAVTITTSEISHASVTIQIAGTGQ